MNGEISNQSIEMNSKAENFKEIKPENNMTMKKADSIWKTELGKEAEAKKKEASEPKQYQDDNGKVYREGDKLLPNQQFERKGYLYTTDDKGRVSSAEGNLQLKEQPGRGPMEQRSVVDQGHMRDTDDRGHLIAGRFNGSGGLENLSQMDGSLNKGDYKSMENTLAQALEKGAEVNFKVEPIYEGNSTRPSEYKATYSIDGEKSVRIFQNGGEDRV